MECVYILSHLRTQFKVRFLNIDRLLSAFAALVVVVRQCFHCYQVRTPQVWFLFCVFDIALFSLQPTAALVLPKTLGRDNRRENSLSCTLLYCNDSLWCVSHRLRKDKSPDFAFVWLVPLLRKQQQQMHTGLHPSVMSQIALISLPSSKEQAPSANSFCGVHLFFYSLQMWVECNKAIALVKPKAEPAASWGSVEFCG